MTAPELAHYYARVQVATANKAKLLCMLHEHCVRLVVQSLSSPAPLRPALNKAQNILAQLEHSLIVNDQVSKGLFYLYDYCYCRLETSNEEEHRNAASILIPLRDTFEKLLNEHPQAEK